MGLPKNAEETQNGQHATGTLDKSLLQFIETGKHIRVENVRLVKETRSNSIVTIG